MGPNGDTAFSAEDPAVAYNPTSDQYLVAWEGDDDAGPLVDGEDEIFVQRLSANGAQVGANDRRVSDMGPNGDVDFSADNPAVAHNPTSNQYLVAWEGDDDTGPARRQRGRDLRPAPEPPSGVQRGANDRRISDMGPDGDGGLRGQRPEPRLQPRDRRVPGGLGGERRHRRARRRGGSRSTPSASPPAAPRSAPNDRRISQMGPDGDNGVRRHHPQRGGRHSGERVPGGLGRRGRRRRAGQRGGRGLRPAARLRMGPRSGATTCASRRWAWTATIAATASPPAVAYGSQANEYLIAWHGDPDPPQANDEFEVFARRFGAGAPLAARARSARPCRRRPRRARATPTTSRSRTGQLLINQRIDQAAIRRANGVEAWLGDGIEGRDLCQGALGASELGAGIATDLAGPPLAFVAPDPRPIVVAAAKPADPSQIRLSTGQLLINQRISQAAIRRLNALKARMDGGLTGGDVDDATLTQPVFVAGLRVLAAPPPASPPAASTTDIAPATPGDPISDHAHDDPDPDQPAHLAGRRAPGQRADRADRGRPAGERRARRRPDRARPGAGGRAVTRAPHHGRRVRRRIAPGLVAVSVACCAWPASGAVDDLDLVSRTSAGAPADGTSQAPSISADGRFVAFASEADNLSTEDLDDAAERLRPGSRHRDDDPRQPAVGRAGRRRRGRLLRDPVDLGRRPLRRLRVRRLQPGGRGDRRPRTSTCATCRPRRRRW